MTTELAIYDNPGALMARSQSVAEACRAIVKTTAKRIGGRQYVQVEGWQSIATAHGCIASSRAVERIEDVGGAGYRAIGEVRRIDTGTVIATAEGFVGDDEPTWHKRPVYAQRAMAQTRAISRACRSAFAHVVVLIDHEMATTPAEEMPDDDGERPPPRVSPSEVIEAMPSRRPVGDEPVMPFGSQKGKTPSQLDDRNLDWYRRAYAENVADETKKKYRLANQRVLDALEAENDRRHAPVVVDLNAEQDEPVPF